MLETQNNLVREVQEAMSAMNTIIKNTREEMMATTNSSQLLMTENMRNLTKALETIKDNLLGRIGSLDGNLGDLNKRLDLTNEAFNESAIRLTQTMETEFGRVDKVMDRFEDLMTESNKNLNDRINLNEERQQQWRSEYEDKNHNVFKEMSNTLKSLKKQILKVNKDSGERDDELHKLLADAKKLTEGMIKNLDEKANHLESLYNFKLDESTKVWENNLQLEVDKLLDAITKNTDVLQTDYTKRLKNLKQDLSDQFIEQLDREVFRVKESIVDAKKSIEEATNNKLKDTELRLEREFRERFDDYRLKLDDSLRDFIRMKNELERIRKDYIGALEEVKDEVNGNTKREVENVKGELVGKLKENSEEIGKLVDAKVQAMKQDVELNKEDMKRSVEAAKVHLQTDIQNSTSDLKNMISHNDQVLHTDVNNKMNSINSEVTTVKKFLVERMDEIHESTKSLARALVNEEAANRSKQDEHIIKLFDRRINNLNDFILSNVEQKLDDLRMQLENKIKDSLIELENFKRWVLDEFSKVRTEAEYFKQEYYARDYADYLYLLTFQDQVSSGFDEIQKQFYNARGDFEELKEALKNTEDDLKQQIRDEGEKRESDDEKITQKHDELNKEYEEYKDLNERTWEEFITLFHADSYSTKCTISVVEEGVYESIRRIIASISNLGGASDGLEKRIKDTIKDLKDHKEKVTKQDKANDQRMDKQDKEVKDFNQDFEKFKQITSKNFQISEEALTQLATYINGVDSRTVADKMLAEATLDLVDRRVVGEINELDQRMTLVSENLGDRIDNELDKLSKKFREEIIPSQILSLTEKMNDKDQKTSKTLGSLTEQMQQQLTQHEIKIEDHTKQLKIHDKKIQYCEENLKDAGQDFKKIGEAITDTNTQLYSDNLTVQAKIAALEVNIALTIQDMFKAINSLENNEDQKEGVAASETDKIKSRLNKIEKKYEELQKKITDDAVTWV